MKNINSLETYVRLCYIFLMKIKSNLVKYKWDIVIVLVLFLLALLLYLVNIFFLNNSDSDNSLIYVSVDGNVIKTFDLSYDCEYEISTKYGSNTIRIIDKELSVILSDCPNSECINMASISRNNQSIICLPHHLVIKVVSKEEGEYDAIAY